MSTEGAATNTKASVAAPSSYVAAAVVLGVALVGLAIALAAETPSTSLRIVLGGGIAVDLLGWGLLASSYQRRKLAVALLKASALEALDSDLTGSPALRRRAGVSLPAAKALTKELGLPLRNVAPTDK